jgi:thiol-disulfide isomerase/thioredoxin
MKAYLPWTARIVVSILFLVSAVSKMFPIWMFEKQLVDLGICGWCEAPYFSRLLIALELAIGIAILQRHFVKRFVIPVTAFLLVAFCVHLSIEMVKHGAMNGNCGCFGQLIPMTPLEAVIKNILTLGLLAYIYRTTEEYEKGQNRFMVPMFIYSVSAFAMFATFPFCPCEAESTVEEATESVEILDDEPTVAADSTTINQPVDSSTIVVTSAIQANNVIETAVAEPAKVKSRFSEFKSIGGKKVNLDEGKKIVCFFAPGCDHCRETAKELKALAAKLKLPDTYIIFMDEEAFLIPEFIKETGFNKPYQVIDIPKFWTVLGSNASTPGLFYLWNGNIIQSFEGIEGNKFDAAALKAAIEQPYSGK